MDHSVKLPYQIHTFGCKVNTYDSGLMARKFEKEGLLSAEMSSPGPRIHVLNTCAVTGEATKEAIRLIRRIRSRDPLSTVVVTGCGAQVDTESFASLPGADLIVANSHKGQLTQILEDFFKGKITEKVFKSNIFKKEDLEEGGGLEENHTRSFLKIQDGCNSFCTFCVIPYARGKSRSLTVSSLVQRCLELERAGFQEIVLTGVHIGDYEDESAGAKKTLEDLIETLLEKTKISRFRLTSLEPIELTPRLLDLFENERLCRHFHLSIQSASTEVLKAMKRKYDARQVRWAFEEIQRRFPEAFVGMDVIAGFPSETETQFEETYQLLDETPWTRMHVFPYSERQGTRALQIENPVPWETRVHRARRLRELSSLRLLSEAQKQVGTRKRVLVLKSDEPDRGFNALSRDYWNVQVSADENSSSLSSSSLRETSTDFFEKEQNVEIIGVALKKLNSSVSREGVLLGRWENSP